jgi:putative CocE/NonD family hydrolase
MTALYRPFLEAGYAVAFVSMRGTGRSDGCLQFGGLQDREDAYDVVEALAAEPWSNGRIGMYGLSYDGFSQFLAMAADPPSLKAVVPMSGVIDLWSLLTRRGAAYQVAGPTFAGLWAGLTSIGVTDPAAASRHAMCPQVVHDIVQNLDLQLGADRTPWFQERDLREAIRGSRIPALVTNGMSMLRVPLTAQEGHILQFEGLWDLLDPERTRFLLGQWPHAYPHYPRLVRPDFEAMVLAFFDEHLRGARRTLEPGVVEYQDDDGTWRTATSWPPKGDQPSLYLSGTTITDDPSKVVEADRVFQSADHDPGVRTDPRNQPDGKPYLSPCVGTTALFVSPPLAEDVHLAGEFDVDVTISSTLPGGHFSFFVHRTKGDGSCGDELALDTGRAIMDLQHWRVAGKSEPFPVNSPTRVRFHSHPMAANLKQGERIIVAIGGGASEVTPDQLKPVITVHTGRGTAGSFTLPVESGQLRFAR